HDDRQQRIHGDAGKENEYSRPHRLGFKPSVLGNRLRPVRNHGVRIPPGGTLRLRDALLRAALDPGHRLVIAGRHPDVPADWQPCDDVLRFRPTRPPAPQRTAPAKRESRGVHTDHLRRQKVPELMHENHEPEDKNRCQPRKHYHIPRTTARARRSASINDSRSVGPVPCTSDSARSIAAAMPPKGMAPARNKATAASFAALNTAGAIPPRRPASMPSRKAGNASSRTGSNVSGEAATGSNRGTSASSTRSGCVSA